MVRSNIPSAPSGTGPVSGTTSSAAELNLLDGSVAGTVVAGKAVVVDASKDVSSFRDTAHRNIDAGASGTAGSVDVFPSTASKGKLAITKTDNTNNDTTSIVDGAKAAARTLTIPDPLAAAEFILGMQAAVARTATADGLTTGTIADAGKIQSITVTSADANHIIVLPTPTPGTIVFLANGSTGYELRSNAPTTVLINGGTGGAAVQSAIPASAFVMAYCKSATAWACIQLTGTTVAAVEAAA